MKSDRLLELWSGKEKEGYIAMAIYIYIELPSHASIIINHFMFHVTTPFSAIRLVLRVPTYSVQRDWSNLWESSPDPRFFWVIPRSSGSSRFLDLGFLGFVSPCFALLCLALLCFALPLLGFALPCGALPCQANLS